jgi:hypothetical protein
MQISSAPPSTICRELLVDGCKKSKSYEAWPAQAAPKKLERPHVPFPKLLRAFALERHHKRRVAIRQAHHDVSGQSKPARDGQMKTGHFESGIAQAAAKAALMRDEPTQREPATFHHYAGGQRLVGAQDCPRAGRAPRDRGPLFAADGAGVKTGHSAHRLG